MTDYRRLDNIERRLADPEYVPDQTEAELNADLVNLIRRLHDERPESYRRMLEETDDEWMKALCREING
jgi:hypothetical protein